MADGGLLISLDQHSHVVYAQEQAVGLRLVIDGQTCLFSEEYDPTVLRVGMPGLQIKLLTHPISHIPLFNDLSASTICFLCCSSGKLIRYLVADGAHVQRGQAYAEVEVMKMYISVGAPEAGHVRLTLPEGSVLKAGDVLGRLELDEPGRFVENPQSIEPPISKILLSCPDQSILPH